MQNISNKQFKRVLEQQEPVKETGNYLSYESEDMSIYYDYQNDMFVYDLTDDFTIEQTTIIREYFNLFI
jgi:hypothetical protein